MLYLKNISKETYLLLLLLLLCGIGCDLLVSEEEIKPSLLEEKSFYYILAKDTIALDYHIDTIFLTESDTLGMYSQDSETAKIILSYPVVDSSIVLGELKDSIRHLVNYVLLRQKDDDLAYQSLEQRMQDFISEFRAFDMEMKSFGLMTGPKWSNIVHMDIITDRKSVVTLRIGEEEFMGGAHPNNAVSYYNIERRTGRKLLLTEIFDTTNLKMLSKRLEMAFIDTTNSDSTIQYPETISKQGVFPLPTQFALLDTAILFQYEAYNLGAFAYKDVLLTIPYDSIYHLLNTQIILLDTVYIDKI